jgi:hypothetical protein
LEKQRSKQEQNLHDRLTLLKKKKMQEKVWCHYDFICFNLSHATLHYGWKLFLCRKMNIS